MGTVKRGAIGAIDVRVWEVCAKWMEEMNESGGGEEGSFDF